MTVNADLIDRLGAAALEAKTVIREAHEAQQDLRSTLREVREAKVEIAAQLGTFRRHLEQMIKDGTDQIEHGIAETLLARIAPEAVMETAAAMKQASKNWEELLGVGIHTFKLIVAKCVSMGVIDVDDPAVAFIAKQERRS